MYGVKQAVVKHDNKIGLKKLPLCTKGEGMAINDKLWQPWYKCYLIGPTIAALHAMATVLYYISYLIGPNSGNTQEWIITFKPWLLPRIQV